MQALANALMSANPNAPSTPKPDPRYAQPMQPPGHSGPMAGGGMPQMPQMPRPQMGAMPFRQPGQHMPFQPGQFGAGMPMPQRPQMPGMQQPFANAPHPQRPHGMGGLMSLRR